ncbi:Inositol-1-monophosphatase [Syntrophobacter sp. SbD1]|nr:Inositol-1-monophosphatase [Syntrophobacter sp. SbD1]
MPEKIETVAQRVIFEAGELIRRHIGSVAQSWVHTKGPSDYVTEIDKKCEGLITEAIRKNFPDHHIMAEETDNDGLQPGYTWVIDPVDGTTNFIHGFPFVAVSIAVCLEKEPILGLVLDPVRNELFSAKKGGGAWLNGSRLPGREKVELNQALVATGFPFRSQEYMDNYLMAFKAISMRVSGVRRAGAAALDLAYLAAGRVDGFWEIGLKAWDIAAGALLIKEAGGTVSDFQGEDNYLLNGNVVGGVPLVYPFLLDQVQKWLVPALEGPH